jgi:hypothetical protein
VTTKRLSLRLVSDYPRSVSTYVYTWVFNDRTERVISPVFDSIGEAYKWFDDFIEHSLTRDQDERTNT